MKTILDMQITYIGYSREMVECLLSENRLQLVSVITKNGVLDKELKDVLKEKRIHFYEMDTDDIYDIEPHILSNRVLIYKYGYIIPKELTEKYEFYNIHPGSLDSNRGAHPVRWTILNGEKETCMTLYRIAGIDEGYVLCEEMIKVGDSDYLALDHKMDCKIEKVLQCLVNFLGNTEEFEKLTLKTQGKYRRKVTEADYTIDLLHDDYDNVQRKIRSVKDFGGAVVFSNNKKYRVLDVVLLAETDDDINKKWREEEKIYFEERGKSYVMICKPFKWKMNGITIVDVEKKEYWNELVKSFKKNDIYYMCEYNIALMLHGDGQPQLIYFEFQDFRLAFVMFKNDISKLSAFDGVLEPEKYYDWTSPYGYGGPLYEGNITESSLTEFKDELAEYCLKNRIVSQFFRFHPLLQNQTIFDDICEKVMQKRTVAIDVNMYENIEKNMTRECRNRVRKAIKNDIEIIWDRGDLLDSFLEIYNATMSYHHAEKYYFFEREYFQYLIENMKDNIIFFYAKKNSLIISAGLFLYNDTYMHYHLGGTFAEYRKYAPFNLLLTSVACWASKRGIKELHLGGGMENEDSLFRFKKGFNLQGIKDFYIGRTIFNEDAFRRLVELRKKYDHSFNEETSFLIKYRA